MPTIPIYGQFESRTVSGALVDCNSVVGGWHIVNTLSDRDNINTGVRKSGMIVYVIENETPYILEINTNPGMTDLSDLPAQASHMGINYDMLVEIVLKTALIEK